METIFIPAMDAFISIDTKLPYIVYINNTTNIIFFNCKSNQIISTIKEAHGFILIINIRHYLYDKNDIILSASFDSNIKLWKIKTLECFLEINKSNDNKLISAFLFQDKKQYFIAAANQIRNINVFDMNGKKNKEFPKSEHYGIYFDSYYNQNSSKNYFLYCGTGFLKSYDYNKGKLFNNYVNNNDKNKNSYEYSYYHFVVYDNGIKVRLIAAFSKGIIRIFNFISAELLSEIGIERNFSFLSLCLWNNNYLFIVSEKCSMKLMDIEKEKIIKTFPKEAENGIFAKIFHHPSYGKCILSQHKDETIKLWVKNN